VTILRGGPLGKITQCLSLLYLYFYIFLSMESYAIVQASGKQFWLEEKKFYDFDKLPLDRGDTFNLNQILLVNQENSVMIGKPFLDGEYGVEATVLRHLSGPKIRVYKMRPKKKTRKTFGSRRKLTRVLVNSIYKK
jgi:large subunit ribosomal protein L21